MTHEHFCPNIYRALTFASIKCRYPCHDVPIDLVRNSMTVNRRRFQLIFADDPDSMSAIVQTRLDFRPAGPRADWGILWRRRFSEHVRSAARERSPIGDDKGQG
jgi:hypothetical protein